jgi:hypothetical protein
LTISGLVVDRDRLGVPPAASGPIAQHYGEHRVRAFAQHLPIPPIGDDHRDHLISPENLMPGAPSIP